MDFGTKNQAFPDNFVNSTQKFRFFSSNSILGHWKTSYFEDLYSYRTVFRREQSRLVPRLFFLIIFGHNRSLQSSPLSCSTCCSFHICKERSESVSLGRLRSVLLISPAECYINLHRCSLFCSCFLRLCDALRKVNDTDEQLSGAALFFCNWKYLLSLNDGLNGIEQQQQKNLRCKG